MHSSAVQPSPVMTGGAGPASYDENSSFQGNAFALLGGPILKRALGHWLQLRRWSPQTKERAVCIADLRSATGENAVAQMELVLHCQETTGLEEEKELQSVLQSSPRKRTDAFDSDGAFDPRTVMAFFSDLPDNDWGTLLRRIYIDSRGSGAAGIPRLPCHVAAVPGSFYERLFPDAFLDLAMCNAALHWLSRLPPEAEEPGWNPGRVWCTRGAPEHVEEAYRRQQAVDLRAFLNLRAAELRPGGLLWLLLPAKDESGGLSTTFGRILEDAWRELTQDGSLDTHWLDSFNIQAYFPTLSDVRQAVTESGAYDIHALECVRMSGTMPLRTGRGTLAGDDVQGTPRLPLPSVAHVWAVIQPQICGHTGTERGSRLYERMCEIWAREPDKYNRGTGAVMCVALFRK
ncbi:S-adenosyl-L-methionine-dependent methyltransferases superfamily protein [Klebsormidium nitens]|uniref:S-adenosyl-L-methionine-dependent methyltransferases superfamily protein n=1 Tax=Klebsormidium nitens TaxID=105231 RepID=A0A1Y1HKB4_KLENI|nr:S-adenosyl-L-methionine-dependent methyltransferases superfamily protein [Klebsormidium nitens]|eukprot:GAQ79015.1 S-adenosyl-L-methionine-dependent methyltransferases superfamily protein [Klebsormidium nitens]